MTTTGRKQNINNLRTEKKGLDILFSKEEGFYAPSKEEKKQLYAFAGIDYKKYQRSVDCIQLLVPAFEQIQSLKDFYFIEVKTTKDKKVTKLPFNVFFGFTQNEEDLFISQSNYRLCIVHTTLKEYYLLDYVEYLAMIKVKRVQYQINFRSE